MKFKLITLEHTQIIAKEIASFIKDSNGFYTFLLYGNLGTGKTTLVREILKNLGWEKPVKSPTFSIVEEYSLPNKDIYHADLYRLKSLNDFEMLGLDINYSNPGILFVEWPEIIAKDIEGKIVEISIEIEKEQRKLEVRTDCDDFLACINRVDI